MERFDELVREFKGTECTFSKMECAFADVTGDEVLDNIGVKELLENKSVSFQYKDEEWLNVEFEIIEKAEDPLETIIKITDIDTI